ncbi:Short-chain dehydrogenase/reductase [Parvularcula bermudensis HTCC2503]|uniref:Short-chain dehydrogenase/reductase n=1 Tax=Parvularcula bermudensis (strain ATCC BAA-594 / HTCC2503 / KCTC 12087) TaxID=314260 RepID=E0TBL7_PARBH|nr:acetoacetyl-CoA reductase [Parvularcula bermudensis]ADM08392.1 Short-chain dehydrogenase/reductase [Parvularcula bermudensis HTCC2503]
MTKTAIVTGGTRGIGYAITARLKTDGLNVVALYGGNDEAAAACADKLGVDVFKCDVSDPDACAATIDEVQKKHGAVDVLVNNAGITRDSALHKMSREQWREVISTNLDSVFNMTQPILAGMRDRGFGRIINISSINGQKGQFGQTNYSAAKAGVIGFTRALAQETARKGITVNAIAPGYIETDMVAAMKPEAREAVIAQIPVGRLGQAEEIAHAVAFLADDLAGFITGAVLTANGGQYIAA